MLCVLSPYTACTIAHGSILGGAAEKERGGRDFLSVVLLLTASVSSSERRLLLSVTHRSGSASTSISRHLRLHSHPHFARAATIARHLRLHPHSRSHSHPVRARVSRHLRLLIPRRLWLQETPSAWLLRLLLVVARILRHDGVLLSVVDERAAELRRVQGSGIGCGETKGQVIWEHASSEGMMTERTAGVYGAVPGRDDNPALSASRTRAFLRQPKTVG